MEKLISDMVTLITEKSGEHLTVIDVSEITTITRYVFIVTVNSKVHAQSLAQHIIDTLITHGHGQYLMSRNVEANNPWILIDASDCIFHLFEKEARTFYDLEKLYFRGKILYTA